MRLLLPVVVALVAVAAAASAAPAQEPTVITWLDRPTMISAYGSVLVWSARNDDGAFELWFTEEGQRPAPLPLTPRSVPFDVDLGPAGDGRVLAVYSRCRVEPPFALPSIDGPPDYTKARGCRLYEFDLTNSRERLIARSGPPGASDVLPSVWKDTVAFARVYARRPSEKLVYARPRIERAPSRRMPRGARGRGDAKPTAMDLYGRRLALAWSHRSRHGTPADQPNRRATPATQLYLIDVRRRTRRLVDADPGGGVSPVAVSWPAFESGRLFYTRRCSTGYNSCTGLAGLRRLRYATGEVATARNSARDQAHARGEGFTYRLRDRTGEGTCVDPGAPEPRTGLCALLRSVPRYR